MKKNIILLLVINVWCVNAQLKKPTMAPVLAQGYYINFKGDTIKGQVQVNPSYETEFYKQFYFTLKKKGKSKLMDTKNIKAYGFAGRHFVRIANGSRKEFAERLVDGRLRFYESKYPENNDDPLKVEIEYFVKDTGADEQDAELRELKKIYPKFYKKNLKPYMKDQPMIWTELDKYTFDKKALINAFREFNQYYSSM